MKNATLFASLMTLAVGCGGSESPYDQFLRTQANTVSNVCDCYAALEFASKAACVAEFGDENTDEEDACIRAIFNEHAAELREAQECQVTTLQEANSCINAVDACDATQLQACVEGVGDALEDCPEPPVAIAEEIEGCFDE